MRSRLIFETTELLDPEPVDESEPLEEFGKVALQYLAIHLPGKGFDVGDVDPEDWGWVLEIKNPDFWLYVGCGFAGEGESALNCFIIPDRPRIWHWFGRQRKRDRIEKLKDAVEEVLRESGKASNLRWAAD